MTKWATAWLNQQNCMCTQQIVRSARTINCPVCSECSLITWRNLQALAIQKAIEYTAKTDQAGQMPRLIWVFVGRTSYFFFSYCGSNDICTATPTKWCQSYVWTRKTDQPAQPHHPICLRFLDEISSHKVPSEDWSDCIFPGHTFNFSHLMTKLAK